jgi:hypothetical protein
MAEYAHLPEWHGPTIPTHGEAILGYGPAGLPHLSQEAESPRVGGPAHGLPKLQDTPEIRLANRPNQYPRRSKAREAWARTYLAFVLEIGIFLVEACNCIPRRNQSLIGEFFEIASRGDPGAIFAPIDPYRAGRGRDGRGRRPMVRLWRSSVRSLSTILCYTKQSANRSPAWDRDATATRWSPPWCCNPPCYKFFCLLRAPLLQERFFLLQYRPLRRQADREKEP